MIFNFLLRHDHVELVLNKFFIIIFSLTLESRAVIFSHHNPKSDMFCLFRKSGNVMVTQRTPGGHIALVKAHLWNIYGGFQNGGKIKDS